MRRKSRYGMDVEFDEGEEEKFREIMTAIGSQTFGKLKPIPAPVAPSMAEFENAVAGEPVENAAAWSADGTLRDRRRSAKRSQVSLPTDAVEGGYVSHNHPDGGPPSPGDIQTVMETMPAELRVVTRKWLYRVQPGINATQEFDNLPGYNRQWNAADIISDQLRQSMDWTEDQADQAVQHALLSWLADQGVIHYERLPR